MWFKNIQVYRFSKPFTLDTEEFASRLEAKAFEPCGKQQATSAGWVPPINREGGEYVHAANGFLLICNKRQDRLLPNVVVNEDLEEKVQHIEQTQGRKVTRKEKADLKEEVIFSLLPLAFRRSSLSYAYISLKDQLLIVNAASPKKADDFLTELRTALDALPVVPLKCKIEPVDLMTEWVNQTHAEADFEVGTECDIRYEKDHSSIVRCKNQDLSSEEILNHIKAGMQVSKLALSFQERIEFVLDEHLSIKRIRFTDVVQEEASSTELAADDVAARLDTDFSIMTLELAQLIERMTRVLGGEESAKTSDLAEADLQEADEAMKTPKSTATTHSTAESSQQSTEISPPDNATALLESTES